MSHITLEETLLYEMMIKEAKKNKRKNVNNVNNVNNVKDERKSIENKKQVNKKVKTSSGESVPTNDVMQKRLTHQGELNRKISMAAQRKKDEIMKKVDNRDAIGQTFNNTPDHRAHQMHQIHQIHHINGIF